uniref:Uncharacterized protein n=2 Tax=Oryza TaxID=4527 RepID=A0A0G2KBL9_9ORYZ
MLFLTLGV